MRYFVPDLRLAVQLDEQLAFQDKFGGLPWGLPPDFWPLCRQCDWPMALLAQLEHHDLHLDLGKTGRVLFAFQCNNPEACDTWDAFSGANACFILEPQDRIEGLTPCPSSEVEMETEARVVNWLERDDMVTENDAPKFYTNEWFHLPETVTDSVPELTKLGSVPSWVQAPEREPGWRFLGQFDESYHFFGPVPEPDDLGCRVGKTVAGEFRYVDPTHIKPGAPRYVLESSNQVEGTQWVCHAACFGDGGMGYLWIAAPVSELETPRCYFFWQCS